MAILLFGVVVLTAVWAVRGIIREVERQNALRRKAIEDEAKRQKECRDNLFAWHDRVSACWDRVRR